jgi:septum formation protein
MDLILASTSRYRRDLLARLGLPFRCMAPEVDESAFGDLAQDPAELARKLASAKAEAVAARQPGALVIGSDQLVAFDGQVLGKPGTTERAVSQLLAMAGREHQLLTAVALADANGVEIHLDVARLWVRPLTRLEVERYVKANGRSTAPGAIRSRASGSPSSTGSSARIKPPSLVFLSWRSARCSGPGASCSPEQRQSRGFSKDRMAGTSLR